MTLVSNVYLTHGLMLLCACAATYAALPESTGRIVPEWRPAVTPLLAAMAALSLPWPRSVRPTSRRWNSA